MLTIFDPADRGTLCDRLPRRNFLKIGALGAAGLTLPQLFAAEAAAGVRKSQKSVILVYLVGGPPHQDMFDLKPNAPAEYAGPQRPIPTNVPGIEICDMLPRMAGMMDKFAVIRSLCDAQADHDAIQCYTGRTHAGRVPAGGWPQFGSAIARVQGPATPATPPYVSVCYTCTHGPYNEPGPGFLGVTHSPFRPLGETRDDMVLQGITTDRLGDRQALLASVDRLRRDVDASGMMHGLDAFTQQAIGVLTSSRLAEALDISREEASVRERYGTGDPTVFMDSNGAPRVPQSFLAVTVKRFVHMPRAEWGRQVREAAGARLALAGAVGVRRGGDRSGRPANWCRAAATGGGDGPTWPEPETTRSPRRCGVASGRCEPRS